MLVDALLSDLEERHHELLALWRACCDLSDQFSLPQVDPEGDARKIRAMQSPIQVAFYGEAEVGKAALVQRIFEVPVEASERGQATHYCHRDAAKRGQQGGLQVEPLDAPILRRFNLLLGSVAGVDEQPWEAQASELAHLEFLVFSAGNPWCAASWNWLERRASGEAGLGSVILVLGQSEGFSAEELATVERHMREICLQRCGIRLPLVRVDAEVGPLMEVLEKQAAAHPVLQERVARVIDLIDRRQAEIEGVLDARRRLLREDGGFLEELEAGILLLREQRLAKVSRQADLSCQVFLDAGAKAVIRLRQHLGVWPRWKALLFGETLPKRFDREVYEIANEQFQRLADDLFSEYQRALEDHWRAEQPKTQSQLKLKLGDFPAAELKPLKRKLSDRLKEALRKELLRIRLREVLLRELIPVRSAVGSWFTLALVFWLSGAVLGSQGRDFTVAGLILLGLALVAFLMSMLRVWSSSESIRESVRRRLVGAGPGLGPEVEKVLRGEILSITARYRASFSKVNEHIALSRAELLPAVDKWRAIYLRVKSLQQGQ